jgi:hypothetical protein
MTSERVRAYGEVIRILNDLGPSKLMPSEQERVRTAADDLLFCEELLTDEAAQDAVADIEALGRDLTESGRWSRTLSRRLVSATLACGPGHMVVPAVAA